MESDCKNWAGRPLESYQLALNYIRTTTTTTGLTVAATFVRRHFPTGVRITDDEMEAIDLTPHKTLPKWNYTLRPNRKPSNRLLH